MAGCDYLPSLKGIGINKSTDFMERFQDIETVVKHLRTEKKFMGKIPEEYVKTVNDITNIFLY